MTEELEACPFCGEEDELGYDYAELSCLEEIETMVICHQCGATSKGSSAGNLGAAEYWNRRPGETAAYIKGLQRAVEIAQENQWHGNASINLAISAIESEIKEVQNG